MLIKGTDLTRRQREQVLAAFIYRWTTENPQRESAWAFAGKSGGAPSMPLISDDEWLAQYAFNFLKDGSRLAFRGRYAQPIYLVD